jgi:hypothetical protein
MKKATLFFILAVLTVSLLLPGGPSLVSAAPAETGTAGLPLLLGAYTSQHLGGDGGTVQELTAMNNWLVANGASGVTFAGDFMSITYNPSANVPREMAAAWDNGFVPFVNLQASATWEASYHNPNCESSAKIAAGLCDAQLSEWAQAFKSWAGGNKFAFIAPLPEMNLAGSWYFSNGQDFIQAFLRIRQVFKNTGVPESAVRWVFAPNGWHNPAEPWTAFENYYPGDANVDVIAFSAYNYGGCQAWSPWRKWDTFELAIEPHLIRMRNMAPSKPIFIAQTGTVGVPNDAGNPAETKSNWVYDTFSKLADYPAVRGIMYFNKVKAYEGLANCDPVDYRIHYGGSSGETGFLNIMKDGRYGKWALSSQNWQNIAFASQSYVFSDVMPSHPFSGAPNVWYYNQVHSLYNAGITSGYSDRTYRPQSPVTRAEMAIFLLKAIHPGFVAPAVPPTFADTEAHWAKDWIEALKNEGITSGYPDGTYRPDAAVTRAEMAIFLLKAMNGPGYSAPDAEPTFSDTEGHRAAKWIEALKQAGITGGYPDGSYRPANYVTRAEMAVFLVKTFNLP